MVNFCQADAFAFPGMLRSAIEVRDRDYKKIFIEATEIDSPCPRNMRSDDLTLNTERESLNIKDKNTAMFETGNKLSPLSHFNWPSETEAYGSFEGTPLNKNFPVYF